MFDIGWTEMALIAVVAVIVIGPKELPKVMREMGTWVARARGLSRVFMDQLEEMSRQSGIDEVRKEAEALRHIDPARQIEKMVDPDGTLKNQISDFTNIGAPLEPSISPPAPETPADVATEQPATDPADPTVIASPSAPPRGPGGATS